MTVQSVFWAPHAWLPDGLAHDVRIEVVEGRITSVTTGQPSGSGLELPGVVLPSFANTHSHAFHRALRGRTHDEEGTFWTWREAMYSIAERLTPDAYYQLARAVYAEMMLAGVTAVGEFHYLHHRPDGSAYPDRDEMADALVHAALDVGVRLTLLHTCYLAGGLGPEGHTPPDRRQRRFSDGDARAWANRFHRLADRYAGRMGVQIGAAIHSVRAVPADQLPIVVAAAQGRPLHVHLSEQPAENEQCAAYYGITPTELLHRAGALGPDTTAVHATHVTSDDIRLLADSGTTVCLCPTTERDLADGIGPAGALAAAGVRLTVGTDQQAVIDLLEEARAVELDERLATGRRGTFGPADLVALLTGHGSLGSRDTGRIEPGRCADLVVIDPRSVRTAGTAPGQIVFAATAADVRAVLTAGAPRVVDGQHPIGDVGELLSAAIRAMQPGTAR